MSDDADAYYDILADDDDPDDNMAEEEDADCSGCKYLDTQNSPKVYDGICMIDREPRDLDIDLYCDFPIEKESDNSNNYIDDYYAYKYNLK